MSVSCKRSLIVVVALGLCFVVGARGAMAKGGHGGGHGGGHHGGHHAGHHAHHSHHHGEHHHAHHHHHHHYDAWAGAGWGWAGPGWGYGGYGLGGWGAPIGGWGNYAANQPMSLPVDSTYANINPAGAGTGGTGAVPGANTLASNGATGDEVGNGSEEEEQPQENQFAANGNEQVGGEESEEADIEARGAIHLALPSTDAKVFLDGQLVTGSGDKRLLLTPELKDETKAQSFHVRTTWEENGRPSEREADVQVAAGNGIAVNFARPVDPNSPATPLVVNDRPSAGVGSSASSEASAAGQPAASEDVFSGRRDAADLERPAAH